jgi:hypothetical protein
VPAPEPEDAYVRDWLIDLAHAVRADLAAAGITPAQYLARTA